MVTLHGPIDPGPQGPEAAQARQGPTQWVFPFGFGGCPWLLDLLRCLGHGVEFMPEPLLVLVLPGCSGLGSMPVLGGSGRR